MDQAELYHFFRRFHAARKGMNLDTGIPIAGGEVQWRIAAHDIYLEAVRFITNQKGIEND